MKRYTLHFCPQFYVPEKFNSPILLKKIKNYLAIIGLGYVGLPLAHAFSEKYEVIGFDIAQWRVDELNNSIDRTLELNEEQVKESLKNGMTFTADLEVMIFSTSRHSINISVDIFVPNIT
jgi:UDP-N-acetyl-D-mannosaminuronate dehydrogenase